MNATLEQKDVSVSGPHKAAILLMTLGEENAANVLQHMSPEEVQAIGQVMAEIGSVSQDDIGHTLDGFVQNIEGQSSLSMQSDNYLRTILESAVGADKAIGLLSQIDTDCLTPTLEILKWMPDKVIAKSVGNEHPQYIAIVLSYLDKDKAAAVLEHLDENIRTNIVMRLARLNSVNTTALKEIDAILEVKFRQHTSIEFKSAGGVKKAAEILNSIGTEQETEILEKLESLDQELSNEIKESLFVFENLLEIDGRGIQTILREVSGDLLVNALKGAGEELREKIFTNMSSRAAMLLRDDIDAKGPMRLSEVEEAQKEILEVVARLAEDGKIQLAGKGETFV